MHPLSFDVFLRHFRARFDEFVLEIHGRNEGRPGVKLRNALTFARAAMGWSGVNMRRQLLDARAYIEGVARNRARGRQPYLYDGQEQDDEQTQRLIVDFIQNAGWCHHPRSLDLRSEPLLLRRAVTQTLLLMGGNWVDRVTAARFFIGQHGANWRGYVAMRQGAAPAPPPPRPRARAAPPRVAPAPVIRLPAAARVAPAPNAPAPNAPAQVIAPEIVVLSDSDDEMAVPIVAPVIDLSSDSDTDNSDSDTSNSGLWVIPDVDSEDTDDSVMFYNPSD